MGSGQMDWRQLSGLQNQEQDSQGLVGPLSHQPTHNSTDGWPASSDGMQPFGTAPMPSQSDPLQFNYLPTLHGTQPNLGNPRVPHQSQSTVVHSGTRRNTEARLTNSSADSTYFAPRSDLSNPVPSLTAHPHLFTPNMRPYNQRHDHSNQFATVTDGYTPGQLSAAPPGNSSEWDPRTQNHSYGDFGPQY